MCGQNLRVNEHNFYMTNGKPNSGRCKRCDRRKSSEYAEANRSEIARKRRERYAREQAEKRARAQATGINIVEYDDHEDARERQRRNAEKNADREALTEARAIEEQAALRPLPGTPDAPAPLKKKRKKSPSHDPEKAKIYNATYRNKQIARWHEENGELTPLCECDCGERVGFDHLGRLNRFAGTNHHLRTLDSSGTMTEYHERRRDAQNAIPIDKFRDAVHKIKSDRSFTWQAMADAGGWSRGQLSYYTYDKRVKSIGRQLGEDFFRRIAGAPTTPSTYMQRKMDEDMMRLVHREATLDRMYG